MQNLKKSRFLVEVPVVYDQEQYMSAYHTMTDAFTLLPETDWYEIINTSGIRPYQDTVSALCEQGFFIASETDETKIYECWRQQHVHDYTTITSKINITRKCNNRCTYCILDYEAKEMTPDTAMAMDKFYIQFIKEKRPLHVTDDYLGGEPLLNFNTLLSSAGRRYYFCKKNNIDYGFTITTNGTLLTPAIIDKMKTAGLTCIRVSLAGPARIHDKLRPLATGGNTYDLIIKNLRAISGTIPITIECQYDSGSTDYQLIPEMYHDFQDHDIKIENIYFTPILKKRGKSRFNCGLGNPKIALQLVKQARDLGFASSRQTPSSLCRADFRSMFVFDTDGSIIPCPSMREGEMAYGHVKYGIDFISESQLLSRSLPERCLSECELLPLCNGGCRQQALVYKSDFGGIDCQFETQWLFLEDYIKEMALEALTEDAYTSREKVA